MLILIGGLPAFEYIAMRYLPVVRFWTKGFVGHSIKLLFINLFDPYKVFSVFHPFLKLFFVFFLSSVYLDTDVREQRILRQLRLSLLGIFLLLPLL